MKLPFSLQSSKLSYNNKTVTEWHKGVCCAKERNKHNEWQNFLLFTGSVLLVILICLKREERKTSVTKKYSLFDRARMLFSLLPNIDLNVTLDLVEFFYFAQHGFRDAETSWCNRKKWISVGIHKWLETKISTNDATAPSGTTVPQIGLVPPVSQSDSKTRKHFAALIVFSLLERNLNTEC